jgi:hypothetical protein
LALPKSGRTVTDNIKHSVRKEFNIVHYDRTIGDICGKNMANTQNLFSDIECRARSVFISPMEHKANMAIASPASDYYFEPLEEEFELRDKTTTKVYSEYGSGDSYRALCKGVREHISADAKPVFRLI